ncbi:DNA-processing protein DprA [Leucobacter sp. HY1910]
MTHSECDELIARIAISRAVEPGDRRLVTLLAEHSAAELASDPSSWLSVRELARVDLDEAKKTLQHAEQQHLTPIIPGDPHWPDQLERLDLLCSTDPLAPAPPIMLWVRGDASLLSNLAACVAVTGSRACTGYGNHVTSEITEQLSQHNVTVVSGAAYGIDAVAHRTALAQGKPTIAVLASGVDRVYPAGHAQLIEQIAGSDCIVSEVLPGSAPTRHRFIMRSRLIAALAAAVVVPEAGARSGALHAAEVAHAMGKPVGAVPGPATSAASAGCHTLIRQGKSQLITSGADALQLLCDAPSLRRKH